MGQIPRSKENNQSPEIIKARQDFLKEETGVQAKDLAHYSLDPATTGGNIENFIGVAQVPIGLAGPLLFRGEEVQGEVLIPLATTEGSLVASYSRGMKVLNHCGGVKTTVIHSYMQRAPVFIFDDARAARTFSLWIRDSFEPLKAACETTTSVGKLIFVERYLAGRFVYLRLHFTTGDAAGQNMVSKATEAGCKWILDNTDLVRNFYLESNFATDKKASNVNVLSTRGTRVVAECSIAEQVLTEQLRVRPRDIATHYNIAGHAAFVSGATNNGLHSANGITALFIATGQDVANVAESSAGIFHCEIEDDGALYINFTIPSLIVGTHGGGTGLATQRECLEIMGCVGTGKVKRLAEIVAGVVLAGEISLAAAISSNEWVVAHEQLGRNR